MSPTNPENDPASSGDSWQTKKVLEHAKQDLQSKLTDVREAARHTAQEVQAAAATTSSVAREGCQALREDAMAQYATYRQELVTHVRNHPMLSLGIAAGVGALVGLLARQAAASSSSRHDWLTTLGSDLSDQAHQAGARARRASRFAQKELHSAAARASEAIPEEAIDRLLRHGRTWLRHKLS